MDIKDFEDSKPTLVFEDFFTGKVQGTGIFYDRFNDLKKTFVVDLVGASNDGNLVLNETLTYNDGEVVHRTYKIIKQNEHLYYAYSDDIVDKVTIEVFGNSMKWTYDLKQKIGDSIWVLHFNDWMHLQPTGIILNRAFGSKFGISIGEVFQSIKKIN